MGISLYATANVPAPKIGSFFIEVHAFAQNIPRILSLASVVIALSSSASSGFGCSRPGILLTITENDLYTLLFDFMKFSDVAIIVTITHAIVNNTTFLSEDHLKPNTNKNDAVSIAPIITHPERPPERNAKTILIPIFVYAIGSIHDGNLFSLLSFIAHTVKEINMIHIYIYILILSKNFNFRISENLKQSINSLIFNAE